MSGEHDSIAPAAPASAEMPKVSDLVKTDLIGDDYDGRIIRSLLNSILSAIDTDRAQDTDRDQSYNSLRDAVKKLKAWRKEVEEDAKAAEQAKSHKRDERRWVFGTLLSIPGVVATIIGLVLLFREPAPAPQAPVVELPDPVDQKELMRDVIRALKDEGYLSRARAPWPASWESGPIVGLPAPAPVIPSDESGVDGALIWDDPVDADGAALSSPSTE